MKKIIVDVMGSDKGPSVAVLGAYQALLETDAEIVLVGDLSAIEAAARENNIELDKLDRLETVHADSFVKMDDQPLCVKNEKADSSMSIGLHMLAEGKGDAFVSAGNTGALFAGANLFVRKIKGIRRPAIGALLPMDTPVLLADSGANTTVTPECLENFALMGTVYMESVLGVKNARVGLLNNGTEACKGTDLQVAAYKLLSSNPNINFVGNVEGNMIMRGACDVVVTDGFTGNILLKTMEGMGKLTLLTLKELLLSDIKGRVATLFIKSKISNVKKRFDGGALGGAPMLGISKPVIKAHGSSNAREIKNAIKQALLCAESGLCETIGTEVETLNKMKKQALESEALDADGEGYKVNKKDKMDKRLECEDGK